MQGLDYEKFKELREKENFELIDIREKYESDCISIGGINIPMGELEGHLEIFKQKKAFVFLCQSGKRAKAVANYLKSEYKVENCYYIEGGLENLANFENIDLSHC